MIKWDIPTLKKFLVLLEFNFYSRKLLFCFYLGKYGSSVSRDTESEIS